MLYCTYYVCVWHSTLYVVTAVINLKAISVCMMNVYTPLIMHLQAVDVCSILHVHVHMLEQAVHVCMPYM